MDKRVASVGREDYGVLNAQPQAFPIQLVAGPFSSLHGDAVTLCWGDATASEQGLPRAKSLSPPALTRLVLVERVHHI